MKSTPPGGGCPSGKSVLRLTFHAAASAYASISLMRKGSGLPERRGELDRPIERHGRPSSLGLLSGAEPEGFALRWAIAMCLRDRGRLYPSDPRLHERTNSSCGDAISAGSRTASARAGKGDQMLAGAAGIHPVILIEQQRNGQELGIPR